MQYFDKNKLKLQDGGTIGQDLATYMIELIANNPEQAVTELNKMDKTQISNLVKIIETKMQQGDLTANKAYKVLQNLFKNAKKAEHGAKLDYIKHIKGICPEGTEKVYLKNGGCLCKKAKMKEGDKIENKKKFFDAEKCGGKMKKVTKNLQGGDLRYATSFINPDMKGSVSSPGYVLPEVTIEKTPFKRNFTVYGGKGDTFNEFTFSGKTPFGRVTNEFMHPIYLGEKGYRWLDFDPEDVGRYIMNGDTIYWSRNDLNEKNPWGVSSNQDSLKNEFYKQINDKGTTALYKESDKKDLNRLRSESKMKKHQEGGQIIETRGNVPSKYIDNQGKMWLSTQGESFYRPDSIRNGITLSEVRNGDFNTSGTYYNSTDSTFMTPDSAMVTKTTYPNGRVEYFGQNIKTNGALPRKNFLIDFFNQVRNNWRK